MRGWDTVARIHSKCEWALRCDVYARMGYRCCQNTCLPFEILLGRRNLAILCRWRQRGSRKMRTEFIIKHGQERYANSKGRRIDAIVLWLILLHCVELDGGSVCRRTGQGWPKTIKWEACVHIIIIGSVGDTYAENPNTVLNIAQVVLFFSFL
jgi:hypothetical protein